jgi:hypothetical protein
MKRFCAAAILLLLGSPSYAGESYSFVVGGRHIHIETSRHCRSTSCVSVSIPGVYEKRSRRYDDDRYDDKASDTSPRASVTPPPAPIASQPPAPPAAPVVCAPAPLPVQPQTQQPLQPLTTAAVARPPAPAVAPPSPPSPPPPPPPAIAPPADAALPLAPPLRVNKVVHRVEKEPEGPLGDWVTEGSKGTVRIEPCGQALCGYVLDAATEAKGEAVLIDMKPKEKSEWSGNIYSRDSGDTYYATMTLKDPNTIEVKACALWRFWCSGNAWSRIPAAKRLASYRQL